ncbi:NAD(P)H-dependent oxidoreductase [Dysgonomonas sp. 520]|uniref:NAD(P)H-dependent oxidoreductase n=1 Tax=Dysgonomonas sp. 520 TaxID=2302931 RepID=UPI0013D33D84|nr:NAD(P)H-dependent oxidoreductase [Dysgonomonas sp. 520]NDW10826.1 flavodoxin family protein [Dysgonomonas sp. 520]
MVTIVFSHPWHGSFNKAILDTITEKYEQENTAYQVIDLHKDNFNPVFTEEELALYSKGGYKDPLVGKYQEMIKKSDKMIFMFPNWWNTMPAILKGFFDKVLLVNFSHNYVGGFNALLDIKETLLITTSESPTEAFRLAVEQHIIKDMLSPVGFKNIAWMNCEKTAHGPEENRKQFLEKVKETV